MGWAHVITFGTFLAAAAAWDVQERRIPNRLLIVFIFAAFGLAGASNGVAGLLWAGIGFSLGLGLLIAPLALRAVGAGDAKFFATVGAFLGPRLAICAFLIGTALGAFPAVVALLQKDRSGLATTGADGPDHTSRWGGAIPYTVPLTLGAVAALVLDWAGLSLL